MDFIILLGVFVIVTIVASVPLVVSKLHKNIVKGLSESFDDGEFKAYCSALNNTEMRNLIISGGKSADRFLAITNVLNEANKRKIPTIVLHSGFAPFNQFSQNTYYDPCFGMDSDEIAEILTDTATNAFKIDSIIHSSIKFIVEVLQAVNKEITLSDVVKFPYDDVIGYLDSAKGDNLITDAQYDKFKQRYNNPSIKDNIFRVAPLFSKLKTISQSNKSEKPINFKQAVQEKQILFFDLLNDTNTILKEMVFSNINKLTEYSKFWVITEGISFMGKEDSKVDDVLTKNRNNISLIYSGEDVSVLTAQREETFKTLVGDNSQLLLFAHASASGAEKWADHFGKEHKEKITTGKINTKSTKFMSLSTKTTGTNTQTST
jgi:hypothetical protein